MKALIIITDGRTDYSRECAATVANLGGFDYRLIVDDSADTDHAGHMVELFDPTHMRRHAEPSGGSASIRTAWEWVRQHPDVEWVFHLEDDFTIPEPVDVDALCSTLAQHPNMANMILRRQPWGGEGPDGYIGDNPSAFTEHRGYLSHRLGFWLSPGVYHRSIPERYDWEPGMHESHFSARLAVDGWSFGVWGGRDDPPRCIHIGARRREPAVPW